MSRRMITVLIVFVLAPLVLATLAVVGFFVYAVDDLFFACDRHRPEVQRRVDRLVGDVPELRLTDIEPGGCDSSDSPGISGRPTTGSEALGRALVDHGCRQFPGPAEGAQVGWSCQVAGVELSIYYYEPPDAEVFIVRWGGE